eukprot:scaffold10873_cov96-Isochrysis_galbana.AAC.1
MRHAPAVRQTQSCQRRQHCHCARQQERRHGHLPALDRQPGQLRTMAGDARPMPAGAATTLWIGCAPEILGHGGL